MSTIPFTPKEDPLEGLSKLQLGDMIRASFVDSEGMTRETPITIIGTFLGSYVEDHCSFIILYDATGEEIWTVWPGMKRYGTIYVSFCEDHELAHEVAGDAQCLLGVAKHYGRGVFDFELLSRAL